MVLTRYEIQLLHSIAGETVPGLEWSAVVSATLSDLHEHKFIAQKRTEKGDVEYCLSEAGKRVVRKTFLAYRVGGEGEREIKIYWLHEVADLKKEKDGWWVRLRLPPRNFEKRISPLASMVPNNEMWEGPYVIRNFPFTYDVTAQRFYPTL